MDPARRLATADAPFAPVSLCKAAALHDPEYHELYSRLQPVSVVVVVFHAPCVHCLFLHFSDHPFLFSMILICLDCVVFELARTSVRGFALSVSPTAMSVDWESWEKEYDANTQDRRHQDVAPVTAAAPLAPLSTMDDVAACQVCHADWCCCDSSVATVAFIERTFKRKRLATDDGATATSDALAQCSPWRRRALNTVTSAPGAPVAAHLLELLVDVDDLSIALCKVIDDGEVRLRRDQEIYDMAIALRDERDAARMEACMRRRLAATDEATVIRQLADSAADVLRQSPPEHAEHCQCLVLSVGDAAKTPWRVTRACAFCHLGTLL